MGHLHTGTADNIQVLHRRDRLVAAAFRSIADNGFEGLRLRQVAHDAGIDHSTLHHYFPTKRDLVAAVVEYATQVFRTAAPPHDRPTTLHQHLTFLGRMIVDMPELHAVLRELDLRATRDPDIRAIVAEAEKGWRTALAARLRAAVEEGAWPADMDPVAGAELVIALVKGASLNPPRANDLFKQFQLLLKR